MSDYKMSAEKHLASLLKKEVDFLVERCYPANVGITLKDINKLVAAAKHLGAVSVKDSRPFAPEEIEELVAMLSPLRQLEMTEEVRPIVKAALENHGIPNTL